MAQAHRRNEGAAAEVRAAFERAAEKIRAAYPGYGFEPFVDMGVEAEWARQPRLR